MNLCELWENEMMSVLNPDVFAGFQLQRFQDLINEWKQKVLIFYLFHHFNKLKSDLIEF